MKNKFLTPERLVLIGYAGIALAYGVLFYVKMKHHK